MARTRHRDDASLQADLWAEPLYGREATLADRFVLPPFSVLNTTRGWWQSRRAAWLALGIQSELGRGEGGTARAFDEDLMKAEGHGARYAADRRSNVTSAPRLPDYADFGTAHVAPGTSIFDPVLCELAYRWWCPPAGTVLDPFAGGSVRGIVAGWLDHPYVGVDLSASQVAANRAQADRIFSDRTHPPPVWIVGDSRQVLEQGAPPVPPEVDFVISCPPYGDLERYSDHPADLSAMSWPDFLAAYEAIIELAAQRLRRDRFACFVVSEVRGPKGGYRGLVPRTIGAFARAGLAYWNEAILVNPAGSLPMRVRRQFATSRKLGRTHQNVLVFAKGTPRAHEWAIDSAIDSLDPQTMFGVAA
jgi:hypothetical protein